MATITAIERQKRRQRFDVHLDGVYAFTLGLDLLVEQRLAVGVELTPKRRDEIEGEDARRAAMLTALQLFIRGPRSEKDLRERLRRRSYPAAAVEAAVTRMRELGYLDDAAFARSYVESRQASTPRSKRALTFELSRRGVAREPVAEAVTSVSDDDAAYAAAQRRLRSLRALDRVAFTRRLSNFLGSRGFSYGIVRQTVDRCWREAVEANEGEEEAASWA